MYIGSFITRLYASYGLAPMLNAGEYDAMA